MVNGFDPDHPELEGLDGFFRRVKEGKKLGYHRGGPLARNLPPTKRQIWNPPPQAAPFGRWGPQKSQKMRVGHISNTLKEEER